MGEHDDDFMEQAFLVELGSDEFVDLDSLPSCGMEYLKRVIVEARQCEEIKVAKFEQKSSCDVKTYPSMMTNNKESVPSEFCPSLEWQQKQEAEFSAVRQKFYKHRSNLKKKNLKSQLPSRDDERAWQAFCYGNLEGDEGHSPLLSIVAHFNQPLVQQLLQYHSEWMKVQEFCLELGSWLYSLMVCLEKPLDPDTCSVLRDVARSCATTRAELESSSDERLGSLNLIICLIARYFDQKDLADNKT